MSGNIRITMAILEHTIKINNPSVSIEELQKYETIRATMNSENIEQKNKRPKIGF
ncbi:hypothetical protein D3C83_229980 [compost metagenome]